MKITDLKTKELGTLTTELKNLGISEKKLDSARETSFLTEGVHEFADYDVIGDDDKKYIMLITSKGENVSLSRLQASMLTVPENLTPANLKKHIVGACVKIKSGDNAGKFYLKTNAIPNTFLQGNQASALIKLVGKKFTCSHIEGVQSVYLKGGYSNVNEMEVKPVVLFKLEQLSE